MTPGQIKRPPGMMKKGESAGVSLFLDVGWTKTENGFFKGYKIKDRTGNYTEITKTDEGWNVEFDNYRTQGITSNYISLFSNHPDHRETDNLPIDRDFHIKNLQLYSTPFDEESTYFGQDLSLEHCAHNIMMLLKTYMEEALEQINRPAVLHFSGGLDTGVLLAIINKFNLPVEIKMDNQGKVLLNQPHEQSPNFQLFAKGSANFPGFAYRQVPLEYSKYLISGHYGGIEMLRFPQHVKEMFQHFGLDYNEELQKCKGSYLYNFLQCADHNCDTTYPTPNYNDISESRYWILDQIKYNMEIQSVEKSNFIFPWRQTEIPIQMLNLNFESFKEHVFHSTVHKKIIEMCDEKIINIIPQEKEKEIW